MNRIKWLTPILLLAPVSIFAQEHPKGELFGGYSYLHATGPSVSFHGWNASVAGNFTSWLGVEMDFSGHHGRPFLDLGGITVQIPGTPKVNVHSFLAGPKFAYRAGNSVTPFAHVLFGATRASFGLFGLSANDTAAAALAGGGLDVRLNDLIAVRAVQADYFVTRFSGEAQHSLRLSFGVVLRFGY